jgi:hypothetical protein
MRAKSERSIGHQLRYACWPVFIKHYSLAALVVPGVPSLSHYDLGHVGPVEDDPGKGPPRAAEVRRRRAGHLALAEHEPGRLRTAGPAVRRDEPRPERHRCRGDLAALEDGLSVAEDEVCDALDVAAFVVVPPVQVAQRVLQAGEGAPVERRAVAGHQRRHRRRRLLRPVVRVLRNSSSCN